MTRLLLILLALLPAAPAAGQVEAELEKFGVGNAFRPGDFAAVRLRLRSAETEPIPVWVQIEVPNGDGDIGEYGRSLTLSGGQELPLWLYIPVPVDIEPTSVFSVRVFQERDGERWRQVGGARVSPATSGAARVPELMSMVGVIGPGQARLGLTDYANALSNTERPPFAHEDTWVTFGLRPEDLPDRWEGLMAFEALAWAGDEFAPRQLTDRQARAIIDYVARGGHLVVSLPQAGGAWELGARDPGPLGPLLPGQEPRRDVGVPVSRLLPVTSKLDDPGRLPAPNTPVTVRVFRELRGDLDRIDVPWRPHLALDDGRVVAVQRVYGFGRVTVVGLDLADGRWTRMPYALQADVFWNRILGRRTDTPTAAELAELEKSERRVTGSIPENSLGGGQLFSQLISMSEQAGRGLLLTFLLFVAYLMAIGPIGFWALKQYRIEKHAWVIFAATAGVFTVAAWGLVSLVKPSTYRMRHLTFLDMASPGPGQPDDVPLQRAASWFSLNMPGYGPASVFIDSTPGQRNLLASWSPPGMLTQPFPNPDRYRVDVGADYSDAAILAGARGDDPTLRRPSRATATQLYAHWMGGLPADWGGIIRPDPEDPARVEIRGGNEVLLGKVTHDLPGELTKVIVIWIESKRLTTRRYARTAEGPLPWVRPFDSGAMLNAGGMWIAPQWLPGGKLDLADLTSRPSRIANDVYERYIREYARTLTGIPGSGPVGAADRDRYLEMYSFFNQLDPPSYITEQSGQRTAETVAFYRLLGRELDLSPWFTGPCLIVIGRLEGAASPIPLLVDGEPPENLESSLTICRWILPLELNEELAFQRVFREEADQ